MVRTAALGLAVLLSACNDVPHAWSRQEIIDICRANVAPAPSGAESRIAELEAEVARLRQEQDKDIEVLAKITQQNVDRGRYFDDAVDRLFKNDETLRLNVNALRQANGWAPVPTSK